ncbi:unnamed protein product [Discosporangium mesarthrocarpum]
MKHTLTQAHVNGDMSFRLSDRCRELSANVVKLLEPLYGCEQRPRNFHLLSVQVLTECGFELFEADTGILQLVIGGEVQAVIAYHLNDLLLTGTADCCQASSLGSMDTWRLRTFGTQSFTWDVR